MIKIAVIDDEPAAAYILKGICETLPEPVEFLAPVHRLDEGIALLKTHQPDLVFLDIEFPEGSGFSLLEQCEELDFILIFITAYKEYAIEAFKHHAFDYIVKPIDPAEAKTSIDRALVQIKSTQQSVASIPNLLSHFKQEANDRLGLPIRDGYRFIDLKDLVNVKADKGYSKLYMQDGESILISKKIGWFEERVPSADFCRIHKSHLVNLRHIREMHRSDGGYIVTSLGHHITVSRSFPLETLMR